MNKLDVPKLWTSQINEAVKTAQQNSEGAYSTDQSYEELRAAYCQERVFWNEGGPEMERTVNTVIPTRHGEIPVRLYFPTATARVQPQPLIVFTHGGGWVLGNPDTHDRMTRILAKESGAVLASVDYTLAPEAKYPQPVEETVDVIRFLQANAQQWNLCSTDISLAGDSGGAHIALASYFMLRDAGVDVSGIRSLLLFYGWYGLQDSASARLMGGWWDGLTREDFQYYKNLAIAGEHEYGKPYIDLLSNDMAQAMPPAYVMAAELDPLIDDSKALVAMLEANNKLVKFDVVPGVIHAFLHYSKMVDAATEALAHAARFQRRHTATK
ncbi:alpha/beta hydrolase fold domain-containing protein [Arcanobacterium bovis]|uniref:Acetylesterase n=1 Tax=Arcanobacterium bovis TaxID=2529275 RepID=A0A4Q9V3M1_9ACTO|nr:alpha/beta hydrolase fold domain-containing protein [Arcanobacterium bovis]TBW23722.1 acetylesterase [Arcanobacterium bovis]